MTHKKLYRPKGWRFDYMTAAGGEKIRYGFVFPSDKKEFRGTVILTGGYGRHIEYYYEAINNWRERGYAVYAMDWHGQGGSGRDNPKAPRKPSPQDFTHHAEIFHEFIKDKVKPAPDKPVFLCSHSKGGNIILRYLQRHQKPQDYHVTAAILAAPMIDISLPYVPRGAIKKIISTAKEFGIDELLPEKSLRRLKGFFENAVNGTEELDGKRRKIHERYRRRTKKFEMGLPTVGWLRSAFNSADIVKSARFLESIKTPVLIITPTKDNLVCIKSQRRAAEHLPNGRQVEIKGARHGIWYDCDRIQDRLWAAIDRFVAENEKGFYDNNCKQVWNSAGQGKKGPAI